jgi:hypothetical protein
MGVPMCSVHGSAMKMGKNGGFFCPRKVGDAWCDQRAAATPAQAPVPAFTPAAAPASPKIALTVAALEFASRIYQGTGQGDDAVMLANAVFAEWKDSV